MENGEKDYLFDKPENVRRLLRGFYVACAGLFAADLFYHRHAVFSWEGIWGFYPAYGFVACVLLVLIAKQMRKVVMRSEDYYDVDE